MATIEERKNANQYTQVLCLQSTAQNMRDAIDFINVVNIQRAIELMGYEVLEDFGYHSIKESHYIENGCRVLVCHINKGQFVYRFAPVALND